MSAVAAQRAEAIAGARPDRLHFLDGPRGLVASFVVFSHGGERMSPAVDGFSSHVLQLGQWSWMWAGGRGRPRDVKKGTFLGRKR